MKSSLAASWVRMRRTSSRPVRAEAEIGALPVHEGAGGASLNSGD